jgi:hypothetical protein
MLSFCDRGAFPSLYLANRSVGVDSQITMDNLVLRLYWRSVCWIHAVGNVFAVMIGLLFLADECISICADCQDTVSW